MVRNKTFQAFETCEEIVMQPKGGRKRNLSASGEQRQARCQSFTDLLTSTRYGTAIPCVCEERRKVETTFFGPGMFFTCISHFPNRTRFGHYIRRASFHRGPRDRSFLFDGLTLLMRYLADTDSIFTD